MDNNLIKTKPWYLSTSIWSGTALITMLLTMCSLYFKAVGSNIGEVVPLVILSLGTYGMNIRGRFKANTQLTITNNK